MLNRPVSFFVLPTNAGSQRKKTNPLVREQGEILNSWLLVLAGTAAQYVRGQKAFGPLHEFIFHGFSLVKGPVAIFLDRGKMDKDVFPGRALNEAIAFGSVEPLHSSLLFHKCNSFRLSFRLKNLLLFELSRWRKKVVALPARWLFPQPMAAVPEGPKATPATGSFGEFQTAVQKHQPECAPHDKLPGAEHNIQELWFL